MFIQNDCTFAVEPDPDNFWWHLGSELGIKVFSGKAVAFYLLRGYYNQIGLGYKVEKSTPNHW